MVGDPIDMSYQLATRINNLERLNDDLYTKSETDTKIYDLVNGAPAVLDSLSELAASINNSPTFFQDVTNSIATKQNTIDASNRLSAFNIASGLVSNTEFNLLMV